MTAEQNKALITEMFAAADKSQSMNLMRERAAEGYIAHFPGMPPTDKDGMAGMGGAFYAGFPGMTHTLHEMVAEGEMVALRMTVAGKHTAPFVTPAGELPPSGKDMTLEVLNLFHMADGKIAEHWIQFDMMGFMQQINPS